MNNSLKLFFLIFNLVPSLTSSVNNFSQPLSETELQMAQNVSEVVERDEPRQIIVHGGMGIRGFSRQICQKPCTLSFPVSGKKSGSKKFLTSLICASQSVFSDSDDEQSIKLGHVEGGWDYRPEYGLEYSLVEIYSDFWSDDSYRIPFSAIDSVIGNNNGLVDEPLPILPTPNRPLSAKDKVYIYGGASGMANGEVLETGVTITVYRPNSCEEEKEQFHDVVKVKMDKPYFDGDLGSPVYVPFKLPNSEQLFASPVGQVVEALDISTERNIWYYMPLDKILKHIGNYELASKIISGYDGTIVLYGGTVVKGKGNKRKERYCTLGFPIKLTKGEKKGFLTSRACPDSRYFVGDAEVGIGASIVKFDPNRGLDYAIVIPNPNYWSETTSNSVLFHLNKYQYPQFPEQMLDILLPITISTQPPFTGVDVCVFGGVNKKMTCGAIVQFNVNINVLKPGTRGKEEFEQFHNVVKVEMIDEYETGYAGAPVYIHGQIPFTSQFIAHPVGQVVETWGQYKGFDRHKKIWYYIPIERILKDSGAELLLGDFSRIGNEQVPMGGNSSSSKLQKRQGVYLNVGEAINLRRFERGQVRHCSLGFAVRKRQLTGQFNQGYLTLGSCTFTRRVTGGNAFTAFIISPGGTDELIVGRGSSLTGGYLPAQGIDVAIIKLRVDYWNPQLSMNIFIANNNPAYVPVIDPATPDKWEEVCYYSWYSGLNCGGILDLDKSIIHDGPWANDQGQYEEDYFEHVVYVRITTHLVRALQDGRWSVDYGAPVFVPVWSPIVHPTQPRQLIGARPVGILGQLYSLRRGGETLPFTDFYYIPIDRILSQREREGLELIQTPH